MQKMVFTVPVVKIRCDCCGTSDHMHNASIKYVASYGGKLCPECRIEWRDYNKG